MASPLLAHADGGSAALLEAGALVALALVAAAYAGGVARLTRRGGRWPRGRTLAAVVGAVAVLAAQVGWVGSNDDTHFSAHATQHVLLALVAPMAVVLAAPLTLGLRVARPGTRRALRRWSSAGALRVLAHPLVAGPLFVGTTVAMYFTPLFAWSLEHPVLHALVHLHLLVVGVLFFWPLIGADPAPVRVPHPLRVGLLFVVFPLHALTAVALLDTDRLVGGRVAEHLALEAGVDPARQQQLGAGILWGIGDLLALAAVVVAIWRWYRAETAGDHVADAPSTSPPTPIGTPA